MIAVVFTSLCSCKIWIFLYTVQIDIPVASLISDADFSFSIIQGSIFLENLSVSIANRASFSLSS